MATDDDINKTPLTEAENRLLARLIRPEVAPLFTADQYRTLVRYIDKEPALLALVKAWEYQQEKRAELKRRWPFILVAASCVTTALGWVFSMVSKFIQIAP